MTKAKCNNCGNVSDNYKYIKRTNTVICHDCIMEGIPKGYSWFNGYIPDYSQQGNMTNTFVNTINFNVKDFELLIINNGVGYHLNDKKDTILMKWVLNYKGNTFIQLLVSMNAYTDDYNNYLLAYNSRIINEDNAEQFKKAINVFLERINITFTEFETMALSENKYKRIRDR